MKKILLNITLVSFTVLIAAMIFSLVIKVNSNPVDAYIPSNEDVNGYNNRIQLNVLNACGEPDIAATSRNYLRKIGFDVVEIGNYHKTLDSSIVIDRVGDEASAYKIAQAMGIKENLIETKIDSSLFLRSTLVLGKNFKNLKPF